MKTQIEVQDRIRTLLTAEFDRRTRDAERRLPHLCRHNHRQELDPRKQVAGESNDGYNRVDRTGLPVVQSIGLCGLGMEDAGNWNGDVCDEPIDAKRCPYFTPTQGKDTILRSFREQVADPVWLQANLPEVHGLLWVLDATAPNYHLPWWKRLWFRFWRIRLEPVAFKGDGGLWAQVGGHLVSVGPDDVHGS